MRLKTLLLIFIWAPASHGCAWLGEMDQSRQLEDAQADDRTCRSDGYQWPSDAYIDCRRFRADARQREQWQELQMARQQQRAEPGLQPLNPVEPYRPIREENFDCRESVSAAGETFIACSERD